MKVYSNNKGMRALEQHGGTNTGHQM